MVDAKPILINGEHPSKHTGQPSGRTKMRNKSKLAYLAGVIDSDGCISSQKNSKCRTYRAYVVVIQKDMVLIEWLYSNFGGAVSLVSTKREDRKDYYIRWQIVGTGMRDLLKQCLPFLVIKKEQAKLAIAIVDKGGSGLYQGKKLPQDRIDLQAYLAQGIKNLNSPATTERIGSLTKEKRQSELAEMKNRQRVPEVELRLK